MSLNQDPLPLEAVRLIDDVCDRFEAALQNSRSPRIEDYLSLADAARRPSLLRALLDVELEYRRAWGDRPSAEEYLGRFPQSDAVLSAFESACDDPADALAGDLLQLALANASGRRTDRLRIYCRGELVHTTTLAGPLELGRQRQGEAPPFTLTQGQREPRLVIAPLDETTISRRHLQLIPEEDDLVRVANLSRINPILFPNGRRLDAEQSESFPLMVEMTLGALFLRIDRPGHTDGSSGDLAAVEEPTQDIAAREPLRRRWWSRG
jgi:hypothetical protein